MPSVVLPTPHPRSAAYLAPKGGEWEIACPSDVEPEAEDDGSAARRSWGEKHREMSMRMI